MADIALNTAGSLFMDWMLDSTGDIVMTSDIDATGTNPVLQAILQALLSFQGEWFLNLSDGFPWFQQVLTRGAGLQSRIESAFRNAILGVPGVLSLQTLTIDLAPATRQCSLSFAVLTAQGKIQWSGPLEYAAGGGQ